MIKAIITDIEGTTTSLSFVKDTLFPYSRIHIADFVTAHKDDPEVKKLLHDVRAEVGANSEELITSLISQLIQWIDEDKKVTPLKALQGLIWQEGYEQGAFHGHLYRDAVENLQNWKASGLEMYVYSSGSVQAQKLLFAHTDYGDLTNLFSGFFDTGIGQKKDTESYRKIAVSVGHPENRILFLSDVKEELDAARRAGLNTFWLVRDGELDAQAQHFQVRSFDDIRLNL